MFMKRLSKSDLKIFIDFYKDSAKDFYKKVFRGGLQIGTRQGGGGALFEKAYEKVFEEGHEGAFIGVFEEVSKERYKKLFKDFSKATYIFLMRVRCGM